MLEKMTPITPPEEAARTSSPFPPEQLSPPIVALESAAVGYGGPPVLKRLTCGIDQDDRIALLGRNGEGKSTLSKLSAGDCQPMGGRITRAGKLRVGYFAQHQVDELHLERRRSSTCSACDAPRRPAAPARASGRFRVDGRPGRYRSWRACRAGRRRGCRCSWPRSTRRIC
jgi:ATPase subunit of ABC transporter with duplicated ATPase domains